MLLKKLSTASKNLWRFSRTIDYLSLNLYKGFPVNFYSNKYIVSF